MGLLSSNSGFSLLFLFALGSSVVFGGKPLDPVVDTLRTERCYRAGSRLAAWSPQKRAKELFVILTNLRKISEDAKIEGFVEREVIARFRKAIEDGTPIRLYIPCFPAKSPNHVGKTLGPDPDMAERIAMERIAAVIDAMNDIHPTEMTIASDGRIFAETWWSTEANIDNYRDRLRAMIPSPHVKMMDLSDYFEGLTPKQAREKVLNDFAPTLQKIRDDIVNDPERTKLYLAFIRFIEGDTPPEDPALVGLTNNGKKKLFKERAIEDIRRSDALNNFLAKYFVEDRHYIRLSIRDSVDTPDKIGINLLHTGDSEFAASPWHSAIVVFPDGTYKPIKRSDAEAAGYKLIYVDGRPDHFEAPGPQAAPGVSPPAAK